ncbi:MAG: peptide ABC transporter substrate-binding protein [Anaerolineales bacterium]|nr:peptide ABC transporter substrate-binding protein [Anaerolineales bacterium]
MKPERNPGRILRHAAAVLLAVSGAGCAGGFTNPPPATMPSDVPAPTPASFSARIYLEEIGKDASEFASRYFSPEGDFSLAVPVEWQYNQNPDSGREVDSVSEIRGGPAVAAFYLLKKLGKEKDLRQSMRSFSELDWMAARRITVAEEGAFPAAEGTDGWRLSGTLIADSAHGLREAVELIAFLRGENVYVLAAYPDRARSPDAFTVEFLKAAESIRFEERRTEDVAKENALQLLLEEPATLDPALTQEGPGGAVGDLFSGLVALDTSLNIRPELAERWDVTPDGRTYTFHLRERARFHNGRPVTADDVLYSWLRAASPGLRSTTAVRYLGDIAGLREYRAGTADSIPGIRIVDPQTLQVTLNAPVPFFLEKLAYPTSWIVDRYNVRLPNWEFNPNGTGPFRMAQRVHQRSVLLETNGNYYGAPSKLRYIIYWITASSAESLFRSGKIDRMTVPSEMLPAVGNPHDEMFGAVSVERNLCTKFIRFNTEIAPFDDPLVRQAFSLSIDREVYAEVTAEEGDLPGSGILPPGMRGYSADYAWPVYDPDQARALLARSRYYDGTDPYPEIRFVLPSWGGEFEHSMEFLVDSWENALGIDIRVEGLAEEEYRKWLGGDPDMQMILSRHCAAYPDPDSFYGFLFHGSQADLSCGYRNDSLDALLDSAAVETDWFRRTDLYHQADRILYDDAPILILAYAGPTYAVWKTRVMGYVPVPITVAQHHRLWILSD